MSLTWDWLRHPKREYTYSDRGDLAKKFNVSEDEVVECMEYLCTNTKNRVQLIKFLIKNIWWK